MTEEEKQRRNTMKNRNLPLNRRHTRTRRIQSVSPIRVFAVVVAALIVFAIFHPRAALSVLLVAVGLAAS